jgi:CubicO group peptidase (beta-lactamase class C family)
MDVNRRMVLGAAALAAAGAGYAAPKALARLRVAGGGKAEAAALRALADYVERHRADWGLPGMTVAVVDRAGFSGFITSGLADVERGAPVAPDHLFQIGSITKMMTALALASLIDEGKLSPETRLEDALVGISVRDGQAITLRRLLDHTSGLPADSEIFPEGGLWCGFAPGSNWSYSNCGYRLAGLIAAAADGRRYPECVEARVLRPLGMKNSKGAIRVADRPLYAQGYEPALTDRLTARPGRMTPSPWVDYDGAAGCVAATSGDMAIFLRFLLDLADGRGAPLLSDRAAAQFLADPAPAPGWAKDARYGNGIARVTIDGRDYLHHTGGMVSFSSSLHVDPEAGVAAFASANVHYALNYRPRDVTTYACSLIRALRAGEPFPDPKPTRPTVEKPRRFAGVYTAQTGDVIEIVAGPDAIRMRRNGLESAMQQATPSLFTSEEPQFAVTGIAFDIEGDRAARLWVGDVEYARDPAAGYRPAAAPDLQVIAGRYDSDDRWAGPLYIYARDARLWIGNSEPLVRDATGDWRLALEESSPERIRFDGVINGRPHRMLYSGAPFIRRFS